MLLNFKLSKWIRNNLDVDKIILLSDGKIKAVGTYNEIKENGIDVDLILSAIDSEKTTLNDSNLRQHSLTESIKETENLNETLNDSKNEEFEKIIASNTKLNFYSSQLLSNVNFFWWNKSKI